MTLSLEISTVVAHFSRDMRYANDDDDDGDDDDDDDDDDGHLVYKLQTGD